LKEAI